MNGIDGETNDATRDPTALTRADAGFAVLVVDEEGYERHVLPTRGALTIGRGGESDLRVKRPWISRRHAVMRIVDGTVTIEDAGSSCGTRVRGEPLSDAPTEIGPGDVIELGSTMLVLQRRTGKIHDRATLIAELREDCARATRLQLEVDVVAIESPAGTGADIALALSGVHSLSRLARLDRTCVAVAVRPVAGPPLARRIAEQLAARGMHAAVGSATFPRDADRPDALLARAMGAFATVDDESLVLADDAMRRLVAQLERLAASSSNVILEGETGVGKDALAQLFHARSAPRGPLVRVSCARIGEADLVAMASAGTVLLNDLDAASPEAQTDLLATLFDETRWRPRVVATSQRELASCTEVRKDLYFRLGTYLRVPPLRERPLDVEALARRFVAQASVETARRRAPDLSPELVAALRAYPWPGNVRELRDALAQAVVDAPNALVLSPSDVPRLESLEAARDLRGQLAVLERQRIVDALARAGGNQSRAAKDLGMPRNTLLARIRDYGLAQPRTPCDSRGTRSRRSHKGHLPS